MAATQFYGIKYPFTYDNEDLVHVDLNETYEDSIKSQLLHVIFTPKGQKLRDPDFGSDLIKYIYDPSDGTTFENIKSQIRSDVASRIPNVSFDDIQILESEDDHSKIVSIYYTIKKGNTDIRNNVAIKL